MNIVVECLWNLLKFTYFILEAFAKAIIPPLNKKKDICGQTVLITGAGSGLGRLLSLEFGRLGCTLIILDINKAGNEETAKMVRELGATVHTFVCDLSKREDIYRVADKVKQEIGDIDILLNNAGIVTGKQFLECPDHLIQKTMDVNGTAHCWTTKCFLPAMLDRNHGHIVSIASSAGLFGVSTLADYCASKFAAVGFDESLRHELKLIGKTGVHTTVICPYYINTGMFDGVQTRFPAILPILDPDWVVSKIMDAILTNKEQVILPKSLALTYALKGIIPTKCGALFMEFFGISQGMDQFTGRAKQE